MSQISYIRAAGDPDYNFAYSDFTVEFFVETSDNDGVQTLFEIANNESAAANLYTQTRFFTAIENGNLNAYAIQTVTPFIVGAGVTVFTSPTPVGPNDRVFYDGQFLTTGEYTISGSTITLLILPNNLNNVLVEIGQVLFQVQGQSVTTGNVHFVSAERFQNQFYLFLDGEAQSTPVPAFNAIPTQVISNTVGTGNLARYDSPALLTIGANKNGKDALFGKFGDFKITNGVSRHVQQSQIQQTISSLFTDANLGMQPSSIEIDGGGFVDSISSYTPEELVPGQIFDTLYMQVYQSSTSNANANVLSFAMFKPTILIGPTGSYSFTMPTSGKVTVPWTSIDAAAASVLVNGNAIPSTSWAIFNGKLTIIAGPGDAVDIISTGPTNYYDVCSNSVSTIVGNVYANSNSIIVSSTTPFITPNANSRGQVFINQECITYLFIDRVNNILSGLMRGTSGTGVPNIHLANSRIISASSNWDIETLANVDPRTSIWYSVPLANTSLQNTNTAISTVLVNSGGLPPVTPF